MHGGTVQRSGGMELLVEKAYVTFGVKALLEQHFFFMRIFLFPIAADRRNNRYIFCKECFP